VGIAVDVGRLYLAKIRLQRALDAAVSGGTPLVLSDDGSLARNDLVDPATADVVRKFAREIAIDNLKANGYSETESRSMVNMPTWDDSPQRTIMRMTGQADIPLFLLRVIPGLDPSNSVTATTLGGSKETIFVLAIDLSGSMADGILGGATYCNAPNDLSTNNKLNRTKRAVKTFINTLSPLDTLGIIVYSTHAYIPAGGNLGYINTHASAARKDALVRAGGEIDQWPAYNATNTQEALYAARWMISQNNVTSQIGWTTSRYQAARKAVVLITDGAPTAFCSNGATMFSSSTPQLRPELRTPMVPCSAEASNIAKYPTNGTAPHLNDQCHFFDTWNNTGYARPVDFDQAINAADAVRANGGANDVVLFSIGIGDLAPAIPALAAGEFGGTIPAAGGDLATDSTSLERDHPYQRPQFNDYRSWSWNPSEFITVNNVLVPNPLFGTLPGSRFFNIGRYNNELKSNFLRRVANVSPPFTPDATHPSNEPGVPANPPGLYGAYTGPGTNGVYFGESLADTISPPLIAGGPSGSPGRFCTVINFNSGNPFVCGIGVLDTAQYNTPTARMPGEYIPVSLSNLHELERALLKIGRSFKGRLLG
jgi:von Willebrand factor type A domain/Putative Flp pilus-assembly TadE/G-like